MRMRTLGVVFGGALASTVVAVAGGFWITVHSGASALGREAPETAVLVEVGGCANPKDATLRGTAEGVVGGERRAVALEFTPTSKPNVYAVKRTWEAKGVVVLSITGTAYGRNSRVVVEVGPGGEYRVRGKGV